MQQKPGSTVGTAPGVEVQTFSKVRIRFRKDGDLRLVSHHDLMHVFERMLRRAGIEFCSTQGFHPKPRLVFAQSLALGLVGCQEVADLEHSDSATDEELLHKLSEQTPPGLTLHSIKTIPPRSKTQVNRVCYGLALPAARVAAAREQANELLSKSECWIERTRPNLRQLNIRPFVRGIDFQEDRIEIDIWIGPYGTARPEEILEQLGLVDLWQQGELLYRTTLELIDEMENPESRPAFLNQPGQPQQGKAKPNKVKKPDKVKPESLVQGPLSFDS